MFEKTLNALLGFSKHFLTSFIPTGSNSLRLIDSQVDPVVCFFNNIGSMGRF